MSLTDLKLTKKEQKSTEAKELPSSTADKPKYPYSLHFRLEKEALKKLGISISTFNVGNKVTILCEAEVDSLSIDNQADYSSTSLGLQIQKMDIEKTKGKSSLEWDTSDREAEKELHKRGLI